MIYGIQFLRFFAAAIVAVFHSYKLIEPQVIGGQVLGRDLAELHYAFGFGASGVHIFFVISGFIMVHTQRRDFGRARPLNFLLRRADRIYPLYWACAAVTLLVSASLRNYAIPDTLGAWLGGLALTPGQSGNFIYVGWTLGYEVYFYLVFALLLSLNRAIVPSLAAMSLFFLGSIAAGQFLRVDASSPLSASVSILLIDFLLGTWAAWLVDEHGDRFGVFGRPLILLGACGFTATFLIGYDSLPRVVTWGLPSVGLVLGLALAEQKGAPPWLRRFRPLGDASYALYLIHPAIIGTLAFVMFRDEGVPATALVSFLLLSLGISIAVAAGIDRYVQPWLRFKPRKAAAPAMQATAPPRRLRRG